MLLKSTVGVGFLSIPTGMKKTGVLGGAIMAILSSVLVTVGLHAVRVVYTKRIHTGRFLTYEQLCAQVLGKPGKALCSVALIVYQYGICIAYVIYVEDTGHQFFPEIPKWLFSLMAS